ncbi:Uncharacterised protein [uncultured archaeon]|nr:Uncharacterised protein [uncultured archaeon]
MGKTWTAMVTPQVSASSLGPGGSDVLVVEAPDQQARLLLKRYGKK